MPEQCPICEVGILVEVMEETTSPAYIRGVKIDKTITCMHKHFDCQNCKAYLVNNEQSIFNLAAVRAEYEKQGIPFIKVPVPTKETRQQAKEGAKE